MKKIRKEKQEFLIAGYWALQNTTVNFNIFSQSKIVLHSRYDLNCFALN